MRSENDLYRGHSRSSKVTKRWNRFSSEFQRLNLWGVYLGWVGGLFAVAHRVASPPFAVVCWRLTAGDFGLFLSTGLCRVLRIRFWLTIPVNLYFYFIYYFFIIPIWRATSCIFLANNLVLALMSGRKRPEKPPDRRRQVAQVNTDMAPSRCQAKRHLRIIQFHMEPLLFEVSSITARCSRRARGLILVSSCPYEKSRIGRWQREAGKTVPRVRNFGENVFLVDFRPFSANNFFSYTPTAHAVRIFG